MIIECPICKKEHKSLVDIIKNDCIGEKCIECYEKEHGRTHKEAVNFLCKYFGDRGYETLLDAYTWQHGPDIQLIFDKKRYNIEVKSGRFYSTEIQRGLGQTLQNTLNAHASFFAIPYLWDITRPKHIHTIRRTLEHYQNMSLILMKLSTIKVENNENLWFPLPLELTQ